jgi:hypothetical protein
MRFFDHLHPERCSPYNLMIKAWMQAKTLCPWTMQRALHAQNQRLKASTTTTALLRIVSFAYQPDNIGGFHGLNATHSGW